jgi:hypothetical protein
VVWALLALIHVPVLGTVLAGGEVASVLMLLIAFVFFVAKFIDAPLLRVPPRRASLVAFCLVTVFLHRDLIASPEVERTVAVVATVTAGAAAVTVGAWRRRRELARTWERLLATLLGRPPLALDVAIATGGEPVPRPGRHTPSTPSSRGPPRAH